MATVVDALIVTLGLDPRSFSAGSKKAASEWLKLKDNFTQTGKEIDHGTKRNIQSLAGLRGQILLLFAAMSGGKSIKQFTSDIVNSDSALGRMARNMGRTAAEIAKFSNSARLFGGNQGAITAQIKALDQALIDISLIPGSGSELLTYFQALGVSLEGDKGKIISATEAMDRLNKAVQGRDRRETSSILSKMGFDDSTIELLQKSRSEYLRIMKEMKDSGPTPAQVANSERFQTAIAKLDIAFEKLGRTVLAKVLPYVENFLRRLQELGEWVTKDGDRTEKMFYGIIAAVGALVLVLGGPITWLAAIGVAVATLYNDWLEWNETGKSAFGKFWPSVVEGWKQIERTARDVWENIRGVVLSIFEQLKNVFASLVDAYEKTWTLIKAVFTGNSEEIRVAWKKWTDSLLEYWRELWTFIPKIVEDIGPAVTAAIKKVFGEAFDWVTDRANAIWEAITGKKLFEASKTVEEKFGPNAGGGASGGGAATAAGGAGGIVPDAKQAEEDIQYLMKKHGMSRAEAAAWVAQSIHENGGRAHNPHRDSDGLIHDGLIAWSPARIREYEKWKQAPFSKSTRQDQWDFLHYEAKQGGDTGSGGYLRDTRNATTPKEFSDAMIKRLVRPADQTERNQLAPRGATADKLMRSPPVDQSNPAFVPMPPMGAAPSAVAPTSTENKNVTVTNTTNVTGPITITTNSEDPEGIAQQFAKRVKEQSYVDQAEQGYM